MKKVILICLTSCLSHFVGAQQIPVYSQYFFNPYLYNPAYVAENGYMEAFVYHRQQWVGIDDAPVVTGFSFHYPTKGRVDLGINFYTEEAVVLRNSSVLATFGYKVPLGSRHFVKFALSGGVGMNNLDLSDGSLNLNDPAIVNALDQNFYFDGQFGFLYSLKGLEIGFSLPRIFVNEPFSSDRFNEIEFDQLDNRIFTASYKFHFPLDKLAFKPIFLYRDGPDIQDQIEGAGILYYQNLLWVGGSYRKDHGPSIFTGFNFKDVLKLSYAFEFAPSEVSSFSDGSHEVHLSFRLGKNKKKFKGNLSENELQSENFLAQNEEEKKNSENEESSEPPKSSKATKQVQPPPEESNIKEAREKIISSEIIEEEKEPAAIVDTEKVEPSQSEEVEAAKIEASPDPLVLKKGIYVVVGVFSNLNNVEEYNKKVRSYGYKAEYGLNPKNKLYYVYTKKTLSKLEAFQERDKIQERKQLQFSDAWVLEVD